MDPNNDTNLKKYLELSIKCINKEYEIVSREADGCDKYGIKYWVFCKNGYSSRSWEVPGKIREIKLDIYEYISKNGCEFNDTTYYYDLDKLKTLILTL